MVMGKYKQLSGLPHTFDFLHAQSPVDSCPINTRLFPYMAQRRFIADECQEDLQTVWLQILLAKQAVWFRELDRKNSSVMMCKINQFLLGGTRLEETKLLHQCSVK